MVKKLVILGLTLLVSGCIERPETIVYVDLGYTIIETEQKRVNELVTSKLGYYLVTVDGKVWEVEKDKVYERVVK